MCRSIQKLYNFDPPATDEEIRAAALQFVRKISGIQKPNTANDVVFNRAVSQIAEAAKTLLSGLVTHAAPRNREVDAAKLQARSA